MTMKRRLFLVATALLSLASAPAANAAATMTADNGADYETSCLNRSIALDDHGFREQQFVLTELNCLPGSIAMTSYPVTFRIEKEASTISAVTICCSVKKVRKTGTGKK